MANNRVTRKINHDVFRDRGPFFISEGIHKGDEHRDYHTHDLCEIGYIFQGSGHYHYLLQGREHSVPIQKQTIALFSGNIPHRNTDPGDPLGQIIVVFDKEHFLCGANRELFKTFFDDREKGPYIKTLAPFYARQIETQLREVLVYTRSPDRKDPLRVLNAFNTILWLLHAESRYEQGGEDRLEPVLRAMEKNPVERFFLKDAAARTGLSERHFLSLFKKKTGLSFYAWQLEKRMAYARVLVENGREPISRIAFETGFESLSSFNRQFLNHHGCSPSSLRKGKI